MTWQLKELLLALINSELIKLAPPIMTRVSHNIISSYYEPCQPEANELQAARPRLLSINAFIIYCALLYIIFGIFEQHTYLFNNISAFDAYLF